MSDVSNATVKPSGKLVPALLCFFLGFLGAHRFVLGKIGTGIVLLVLFLLEVVLFITGIGALVATPLAAISGIWILIDFIRILVGSLKR